MNIGERVIQPWKKAVESRDRVIESLKRQRDAYKERLGEFVTALKDRDDLIRKLVEERDDLDAKLKVIEEVEKPDDVPEVTEHELPVSPGAAPGAEEPTATP